MRDRRLFNAAMAMFRSLRIDGAPDAIERGLWIVRAACDYEVRAVLAKSDIEAMNANNSACSKPTSSPTPRS